MERAWTFGALPRFGSGVLRRRPLIVSLPALERFFIASTVGRRHRTRVTAQTKSGLLFSSTDRYAANSSSYDFASFRSRVSKPSVNHP